MKAALFVACLLVGSISQVEARSVVKADNPITKVITLLGKLQAQIQKEGAEFAAQYDKAACYCKDQSDEKKYEIDKSAKLIAELTAAIEKLGSEIDELTTLIGKLETKIEDLKKDIEDAEAARATAKAKYDEETESVDEAIEAVEGAIKVITYEKSKMKDAKLNLAQLPSAVVKMLQVAKQVPPSGKPHAYEYKSNDILGMLEKLKDEFKEQKEKLDKDEIDSIGASKIAIKNLENEKKFAEQDKTEAEAEKAAKEQEKADKEAAKKEEEEDMEADQTFLDELVIQCQTKAEEWDANSKTRSGELTAIAQAIDILKAGVKTTYMANDNLAGLDLLAKGKKISKVQPHRATSFLQVRESDSSRDGAARRALQLVSAGADRLKSANLEGLSVKLQFANGGYDTTIDLIKGMIADLEKEGQDEEAHKSACQDGMSKAITNRDKLKNEIQAAEATIASKMAAKAEAQAKIGALSAEIGEIAKGKQEATELHTEEGKALDMTLEEAEAGKKAVDSAIEVLTNFYTSAKAALIQKQPVDREGNALAVGTTEAAGYEGKQEASQSVLGLLEEIKKDFEATIAQATARQGSAKSEYDELVGKMDGDTEAKSTDKETTEGNVVTLDSEILEAQETLKTKTKEHQLALAEVETLVASCTTMEGSFAERKQKREEEIAVLNEVITMLTGFDAKKGVAE